MYKRCLFAVFIPATLFIGCGSGNVDRGESSSVDAKVLNEKLGKAIIASKKSRAVIESKAKSMNSMLGNAMKQERED